MSGGRREAAPAGKGADWKPTGKTRELQSLGASARAQTAHVTGPLLLKCLLWCKAVLSSSLWIVCFPREVLSPQESRKGAYATTPAWWALTTPELA